MDFLLAFLGGTLIGLASLLLLLFNGRILGVSGIVGGIFQMRNADSKLWRHAFLTGLWIGGALLFWFFPSAFSFSLPRSIYALLIAGLLVGFGTRLGGGCTSGHGICGMSRLSPRSVVATLIFIACGAIVVFCTNHFLEGQL